MNDTTITRRRAIGTGTLFLGAGLMAAAGSPSALVEPQPAAIDRAEAAMHQIEAILLDELDDIGRLDVVFELDRLSDIGKAADPHAVAADYPRQTGANRTSIVDPYPWDTEA